MFQTKKKREKRHQKNVAKLMALYDMGYSYWRTRREILLVEIDKIFRKG